MGKIMEAVFCVFYLIFTAIVGVRIVMNAKQIKDGKKNKELMLFGIMTLTLVFGDAFHLVPRIFAAINRVGDYHVSLGIGKMITSITMTAFYLILYFIYEMHFEKKNPVLRCSMIVLAVARIALCLFPQNDWTGAAPVIWGVYRNIPFTVMGIIMIVLYFMDRADKTYRFMWLGILLSFAFYIPVVLWADVSPMIGMMMLPKTCMYMWIVVMGYKDSKALKG